MITHPSKLMVISVLLSGISTQANPGLWSRLRAAATRKTKDLGMSVKYGKGYLHKAVQNQDSYRVEQLLHNGANGNKKAPFGNTPLHKNVFEYSNYCDNSHNKQITNTLLSYGANLETQDAFGDTPLKKAVRYDTIAAVKHLHKTGRASLTSPGGLFSSVDKVDGTLIPMTLFVFLELADTFLSTQPILATASVLAGLTLSAKQVLPHVRYNTETPLHIAAKEGSANCVAYLAQQREVGIDATDLWGNTPEDVAANEETRRILRQYSEIRKHPTIQQKILSPEGNNHDDPEGLS